MFRMFKYFIISLVIMLNNITKTHDHHIILEFSNESKIVMGILFNLQMLTMPTIISPRINVTSNTLIRSGMIDFISIINIINLKYCMKIF